MPNTTISITIDEKVKEEAQDLFESMGLNMSTAINVFLIQSVAEHRIPFEIKQRILNETTINAIKECEDIISNNTGKTFNTFDEFLQDLNNDDE